MYIYLVFDSMWHHFKLNLEILFKSYSWQHVKYLRLDISHDPYHMWVLNISVFTLFLFSFALFSFFMHLFHKVLDEMATSQKLVSYIFVFLKIIVQVIKTSKKLWPNCTYVQADLAFLGPVVQNLTNLLAKVMLSHFSCCDSYKNLLPAKAWNLYICSSPLRTSCQRLER